MKKLTALRVLLYCCLAVPATAQSTFAGVQVTGHPTLYVTLQNGREIKGKLATLTDEALTITVKKATRTFTPDELVLVERRGDSLANGMVAGLIVAAVCAFTCGQGLSSAGELPKAMLVNALFPVGLDAINIGRTRIWPATNTKRKVP